MVKIGSLDDKPGMSVKESDSKMTSYEKGGLLTLITIISTISTSVRKKTIVSGCPVDINQ